MSTLHPLESSTTDQRLALLDDLRHAERRAIGAQVAAVIAHLVGTPLHVIAGRASLIRDAPADATVSENATRIEDQVHRLAERLRGLIDYLTLPDEPAKPEPAASVIVAALALYGPIGARRGVTFETAAAPPLGALVEGRSALAVLTGLLSFAARVATEGAVCTLGASVEEPERVVFSLGVPGLEPPIGAIDNLEPPERADGIPREELQMLSLSAAVARRVGGSLEVTREMPGQATIRYSPRRLR
jgi:signal transduction histidine kinase